VSGILPSARGNYATVKEEIMSAESYVKLRKLTAQDGEPIEKILQRAAGELRGLGEKASIQLRLVGSGSTGTQIYSMRLTPTGAHLHADAVTNPTLVVIATTEVFHRMAEGSYSPLQAYLDGKMKLQGNVELGRRVIQHLAGSGTQVAVCPLLINESWKLDGPGYGSLTVSGELFTPGGTVDIVYDWGGGLYRRIVTADSNGNFTVTEHNLYCGDIPGHPGIGVIVTATDLSSGQYATQSYATPC
jgi:putative sterol carrier protein